ncbi:MAG: hypothetical protein ACR2HJ_03790 [Fimbriimonadales bacterium]
MRASVGTVVQGGGLAYYFRGLVPGAYQVFTYAVNITGSAIDTPVTIPEANEPTVQIVTGPMPGNDFEYLLTHSIHQLNVPFDGGFTIVFEQPPGKHTNQNVNGFQIVPIPEPGTASVLSAALFVFILRRNVLSPRKD